MTPHQTIAHYRITSRIGEGGMGAVYRAQDTKLGRDVAIKVLPPALANDADYIARFQREAQVLASLNHPNIAAIYGLEENAIVMELVEGAELKGPLPLDEVVRIAKQIADALEAAHERGIVHRDLKPANIKITADGTVKVLDFGLAKATHVSATAASTANSPTLTIHATTAGMILGTAAYMAPEQARGQAVDKRADIWAFGVVLWEMLTGRQMFEGETVSDILAAVLRTEPDLAAVPASARRMISACLEKDPRKRLRDIGDWRRFVEDQPAPAEMPHGRRLPWAVAAGAVAIAAIAFAMLPKRSQPQSRPIHVVEEQFGTLDLDSSRGPAIAISPDGSSIVYGMRDAANTRLLSIRRLDQAKAVPIAGTENATSIFFTPDSRWVAFGAKGAFFKVSVDGGVPVEIAKGSGEVRGATWAPDGSILFGSRGGPLLRAVADGGDPQPFTTLAEGELDHRWPALCRHTGAVVFHARGPSQDGLYWLPVQGGERKALRLKDASFPRCLDSGELLFMRRGILHSVRLDSRMQLMSEPHPVIGNIAGVLNLMADHISVSDEGTAAFIPGYADNDRPVLSWIDGNGRASPIAPIPNARTPRLSPDGKRVAFQVQEPPHSDLYVRDLERNTTMRLTTDRQRKMPGQVWTPDGRFLLYGIESGGVYLIPSTGNAPPQKVLDGRWNPRDFRNDRKWLLLAGERDIHVAPVTLGDTGVSLGEPKHIVSLAGVSAFVNFPSFSPDGRWIVYTSNEAGQRVETYLRSFDGSTRQMVAVTGSWPIWSANGHFTTGEFLALTQCRIRPDTFQCDSPRSFPEHRLATRSPVPMFDVAPDGRILALLTPAPAKPEPPRVHLLFNFRTDRKESAE